MQLAPAKIVHAKDGIGEGPVLSEWRNGIGPPRIVPPAGHRPPHMLEPGITMELPGVEISAHVPFVRIRYRAFRSSHGIDHKDAQTAGSRHGGLMSHVV